MARIYSWIPDLPDQRDLISLPIPSVTLPDKVDQRNIYSKVYDQGPLGSCTANAIALAYDFERVKQGLFLTSPSRLFIYFNERDIEGTTGYDAGAMLRNGIKAVAKQGICGEKRWPYVISRYRQRPPDKCYNVAKDYVIKEYARLLSLDYLLGSLADGNGFVFGFSVYQSFESSQVAESGIVPFPEDDEKLMGGHAVYCLGYDKINEHLICRNSWGGEWGDGGHFYLPFTFVTRGVARDFWNITLV